MDTATACHAPSEWTRRGRRGPPGLALWLGLTFILQILGRWFIRPDVQHRLSPPVDAEMGLYLARQGQQRKLSTRAVCGPDGALLWVGQPI